MGKLECDECNFRSNTLRKLEDHEREMHGPVDGKGGWKNSFWEAFCQTCFFFWLRDDVLGDRTHPDHTRYVEFLNALMMVAIMKMMMAMMTV